MAENKNLLNSQVISELLGKKSEIFVQSINFLKEQTHKQIFYEKKYKEWREVFTNIYGHNLTPELFLKHTYFTHILKIIIISKLSHSKNLNFEAVYDEYVKKDLKFIFEFDYFFWTVFHKELFKTIYIEIKNSKYAKQDLFSNLYQEVFLSDIRHKIGEFFTPSNLVQIMIDDVYKIGSKILDPSCGSGNFLVNAIIKIIDSSESILLKSKAISNVYGFDVNPLAIMTTKLNIFLLLLENFDVENYKIPDFNIFLIDSLFPEFYEEKTNFNIKKLYNSFDLVIGNPPWLTYKDIFIKEYQVKIRELSGNLGIKPPSQYITHIELAAVFFYAIPLKFLKLNGKIFFVITKSVLNGDHCFKFRSFSIFNNLEIWDFPNNYFFNVNHICLKAEYIGKDNKIIIYEKYPIKTKLLNYKLELQEETMYNSLRIEDNGAKLILPNNELKFLNNPKKSTYKDKFFQGATLVPRSLVFFKIEEKRASTIIIRSDSDVLSRAKKKWKYRFQRKEIESEFQFKTFLNKDLIPFFVKDKKNVFLPINHNFDYNVQFLKGYPKALRFYKEINKFYKEHKKETSSINSLYANLNYWNKLKKQFKNKSFIIVYNASGSNLKAAVINNKRQRIIIGSENYYYSTNSQNEAYYLSAILNSPILTHNIKMIKSSRHIHKRPFMFPIPLYNNDNLLHKELAKLGKKCENVVQDLYLNNPKINSEKVRTIINQRLLKLDKLMNDVVFN
ncbi:MAG: class I SAM-dependent DNA methyltransferase [Candidatus Hodarchaeota archaeon]